MAEHGVGEKQVNLGTKPKDYVSRKQRYIQEENSQHAGHARKRSQVKPRTPAQERILNYKTRPREPKLTKED